MGEIRLQCTEKGLNVSEGTDMPTRGGKVACQAAGKTDWMHRSYQLLACDSDIQLPLVRI